jgi:signal transduction histidine kinase
MAVMGDMINNIAHQWRQPLNILAMYLQYLPRVYNTEEFNRELLDTSVDKSMKLIMHMSQTIEDFMGFFKLDQEKEIFRVDLAIGQTLCLIEEYFKSQKVTITTRTEGNPTINGSPNEFTQVLLNILSNARDALVANHVENAKIAIHTSAHEGKTSVTISDNAGGIDPKYMGTLFDQYVTTKVSGNGTGIGLFMSKAIIPPQRWVGTAVIRKSTARCQSASTTAANVRSVRTASASLVARRTRQSSLSHQSARYFFPLQNRPGRRRHGTGHICPVTRPICQIY